MKRLVNTELFCLLKKMDGTFNPNEREIAPIYDEFIHKVKAICISDGYDTPAYFTIHYTRLELEGLQMSLSDEGAGKKCLYSTLYRS